MEYRIFVNERGVLCASVDGITLHSTRDPEKESDSLIRRTLSGDLPGIIAFGSGLLYHLDGIRRAFPEADLICLEPDELWVSQLADRGMDPAARCDHFLLMTGSWEGRIREAFQKGYGMYVPQAYRRLYPEQIRALEEEHLRYRDRAQVNRNTLKRFGSRWVGNLLANFLFTDQGRGINRFIGALRGVPALLLAGGPSLTTVLPLLGELKKRMIIVAVDTAYASCRRAGTEPDFVLAVDPQYWNTKHIERPGPLPDGARPAILVSESSTHPRTFRLLDNPTVFSRSLFPLGEFLESGLEPRIPLGSGGSVATTAWDFLRICGCPRIYAAGLDMGFPGSETHFRGSYFEQTMAFSGTRLAPAEQASAMYLRSGSLSRQRNYAGGTVLSDRRMDIYCNWFEHQIETRRELNTYTLDPRGREIRGIAIAEAEELLAAAPIRDRLDGLLSDLITAAPIPENPRISTEGTAGQAQEKLAQLDGFLRRLVDICDRARGLIDSTVSAPAQEREGRMRAILSQLDETDRQILSEENRRIAGFLINDVTEALSTQNVPSNLAEALERSDLLYRELSSSAVRHLELIDRHYNRFKFSPGAADTLY
jgi:hypothetical protein